MKKNKQQSQKTLIRIAMLGLFSALILLLSFTVLGYLKVGIIEITFIVIPVAVGAVLLGPSGGAILGGVFGITSLFQAASGMSPFGAALMAINPLGTIVTCLVPRILMGLLAGLVFRAIASNDGEKRQFTASAVTCFAAPFFNTLFFMTSLLLFFWNSDYIQGMAGGMKILPFVFAFVGINGLIEVIACLIIGTAASKAILTIKKKIDF